MIFLAAFVIVCAGVFTYEALYIWPIERCEDHGGWWDGLDKVCAVPVPISQFTGRTVGGKLLVAPAPKPTVKPTR